MISIIYVFGVIWLGTPVHTHEQQIASSQFQTARWLGQLPQREGTYFFYSWKLTGNANF